MIHSLKSRLFATTYQHIAKPILFRCDPEYVHDTVTHLSALLGQHTLTKYITRALFHFADPILEQHIAGIHFQNPIGLAAGFDKNAQLVNILPDVGFGFEEIGSVTGEPCSGNNRPRLWRHPEQKSLRVYYGLKNDGANIIAKRLLHHTLEFPIGVNIAKTNCAATVETDAAIADYIKAYLAFDKIGNYFTVNISCPNTFGGQPFTDTMRLDQLLSAINAVRDTRPIFLKLSPDLSETELHAIAEVALAHRINGLITSNLTKQHMHGNGELSGKAVEEKSIAHLTYLRKTFENKFILIACGGVFTAEDAYRRIRLGASLIQLLTGMIYQGPQVVGEINRGLVEHLKRDGFTSITEAIGVDLEHHRQHIDVKIKEKDLV